MKNKNIDVDILHLHDPEFDDTLYENQSDKISGMLEILKKYG